MLSKNLTDLNSYVLNLLRSNRVALDNCTFARSTSKNQQMPLICYHLQPTQEYNADYQAIGTGCQKVLVTFTVIYKADWDSAVTCQDKAFNTAVNLQKVVIDSERLYVESAPFEFGTFDNDGRVIDSLYSLCLSCYTYLEPING